MPFNLTLKGCGQRALCLGERELWCSELWTVVLRSVSQLQPSLEANCRSAKAESTSSRVNDRHQDFQGGKDAGKGRSSYQGSGWTS